MKAILAVLLLVAVFFGLHANHEGLVLLNEHYTTLEYDGVDLVLAADGEHVLLRTNGAVFPVTSCGFFGLRLCTMADVVSDDYIETSLFDYRGWMDTIDPERSCFMIQVDQTPSAARVGCGWMDDPEKIVR